MTGPVQTQEALVLGRAERGEQWWLWDLLTDQGVEVALSRRRRQGGGGEPDLFDLLDVELERREGGGSWFVRSFQIRQRRTGLGRSYAALAEASRWAAWLRRHGSHLPEPAVLRGLLGEALTAWETGRAPEVVGLKFGWRLARAEGWPVREDWLVRLDPAERERAVAWLSAPVAELTAPAAAAAHLRDDLLQWLENQVR